MSKGTADILEGDTEYTVQARILAYCGVDPDEWYEDHSILTRSVLEAHYDEIRKYLGGGWGYSDAHTRFLVLGYIILCSGAYLPEDFKEKVFEAIEIDMERDWGDITEMRLFTLKDLSEKLVNHKLGISTRLITLRASWEDYRLFGVIGLEQLQEKIDLAEQDSLIYRWILHINLDNCSLTKIPKIIFKFENLKTLSLNHNFIKCIPKSIASLKFLNTLSLIGNYIDNLPVFINELPDLKYLYLRNNHITNLPTSIKIDKSLTIDI